MIIGLAGFAGVLATPVARHLLNDPSASLSLIPVWVFLGGAAYAVAVYWLGGGLLYGAARRFGGLGSFRRARSVLALSSAPLALALFTLWPVRIAIYGQNLFRTGGDDWGPGDRTFGGLLYFAFAWVWILLLVIGVRSVDAGAGHDHWRRSGSRQRSRPWWSSPRLSRPSDPNLSDLVTDSYKVLAGPRTSIGGRGRASPVGLSDSLLLETLVRTLRAPRRASVCVLLLGERAAAHFLGIAADCLDDRLADSAYRLTNLGARPS